MKTCPNCGHENLCTSLQCFECGYNFDDVLKCPHCGTYNYIMWTKCKKCSKKINNSEETYENDQNDKRYNKKAIKYDCIVCHNIFTVNVNDRFNAFACEKCRSIFSYEWENNKLLINIIKKGVFITDKIKKLIEYFDLEFPIEQDKLKKNYHKLLSQYHPDKVSHLGKEFIELSERKTKEIIENYEVLINWIASETKIDGDKK